MGKASTNLAKEGLLVQARNMPSLQNRKSTADSAAENMINQTSADVESEQAANGREAMSVLESGSETTELEYLLQRNFVRQDKSVKRTFEIKDSHVEIIDRVVKKAKQNGKKITQSDALQFIIANWNEKLGSNYLT